MAVAVCFSAGFSWIMGCKATLSIVSDLIDQAEVELVRCLLPLRRCHTLHTILLPFIHHLFFKPPIFFPYMIKHNNTVH
jgi:hypothetical protein